MKLKINDLKPNQDNPRIIKDIKFKKLVRSIKDFPEMLELRPIVVDEDMTILGGNMRYRACIEAGIKQIPVKVAKGLTDSQKKEFIVKDNLSFGEWDWDILGNEFNFELLDDWALDLPSAMFKEDIDYSILDEEDFEEELDGMEGSVRRALQIPFEADNYEEAKELYKFWVDSGAYVGGMIMEFLKSEKEKI
jgi:hypothetical protein